MSTAKLWHWLVENGLYRDILAAVVAGIVAHVFAWRPLKAHRRGQDKIADLLDTSTPGGLADLLDALPPPDGPKGHAR